MGKDAVAFGLFFTVFELGRDFARDAGLAWDGRSAREERDRATDGREDGERRKRSRGSLVVQSFLILLAGGMAGWTFGLVSRPFERARGAIWEGRARWAASQARGLEVEIVEVTKRRGRKRRRRRTRGVGRTFVMSRRRIAREKALKIKVNTKLRTKHLEALKMHESKALSPRQPMPSSLSLIRTSTTQHGFATFFLAPRPVLDRQSRNTLPTTLQSTPPRRVGPTRLSARGKLAEQAIKGGTVWRKGARVLAYVPPYALGFFVYALMSGDLK